jgi:competence protein ComEA
MSVARLREHLLVVLLNLTALGVLAWQLRDPRLGAVYVEPAPTRTPAPSATPMRLHVHVSGAVRRPDVVALPEGARARDAVAAAGGFAPDADRAGLNLAAPLGDGVQLHVPALGESAPPAAGVVAGRGGVTGGAGAGGASSAGGSIAAGGSGAPGGAGGAIDVNRASAAELEALPGVGPALAARIVAHREANGPFGSPEDLLQVSGIGAKTLARMADAVVVR